MSTRPKSTTKRKKKESTQPTNSQRITVKVNPINPFQANLRGELLGISQPLEFPEGWEGRAQLALVKFDYCNQQYWVARSKIKTHIIRDTYETILETGPMQFFSKLQKKSVLDICECIGQISLPNYFHFKTPLISFEDGSEIDNPECTPVICATSTRLFTLFSKISFPQSIELLLPLLEKLLHIIFQPPMLVKSSGLYWQNQYQHSDAPRHLKIGTPSSKKMSFGTSPSTARNANSSSDSASPSASSAFSSATSTSILSPSVNASWQSPSEISFPLPPSQSVSPMRSTVAPLLSTPSSSKNPISATKTLPHTPSALTPAFALGHPSLAGNASGYATQMPTLMWYCSIAEQKEAFDNEALHTPLQSRLSDASSSLPSLIIIPKEPEPLAVLSSLSTPSHSKVLSPPSAHNSLSSNSSNAEVVNLDDYSNDDMDGDDEDLRRDAGSPVSSPFLSQTDREDEGTISVSDEKRSERKVNERNETQLAESLSYEFEKENKEFEQNAPELSSKANEGRMKSSPQKSNDSDVLNGNAGKEKQNLVTENGTAIVERDELDRTETTISEYKSSLENEDEDILSSKYMHDLCADQVEDDMFGGKPEKQIKKKETESDEKAREISEVNEKEDKTDGENIEAHSNSVKETKVDAPVSTPDQVEDGKKASPSHQSDKKEEGKRLRVSSEDEADKNENENSTKEKQKLPKKSFFASLFSSLFSRFGKHSQKSDIQKEKDAENQKSLQQNEQSSDSESSSSSSSSSSSATSPANLTPPSTPVRSSSTTPLLQRFSTPPIVTPIQHSSSSSSSSSSSASASSSSSYSPSSSSSASSSVSSHSSQHITRSDPSEIHPNKAILRIPVFPTEAWKGDAFNKEEVDFELTILNVVLSLIDCLVQLVGVDIAEKEEYMTSGYYLLTALQPNTLALFRSIIPFLQSLHANANAPAVQSIRFLSHAADGTLPGYFMPFLPSTYDASTFGLQSPYPVAALSNKNVD
ncbi:uncharacterized protein MONOS_1802 [Monocercomonoides exilis]|uniref:uncharacterized protein n=1 Tax=Monocercomonoides exilis TaxID=2049356 RepID=UPI0035597F94|nr:hypothetical protein MONOS_1802 [Monocercomonoides exilis]|eukprot:MONOS_1802.1-p1 / transcript=MONOS_1802.1 / gene=MONOS_1802 / organism=Monocercomonoides_exilis_PA203 / gene_product=unspecified product / transcript_product=unspecified product / location=Mono_scaffold00034:13669-16680(+) / protein_length=982 / sequence_SO=supercontig / SO=protein_coding / is_pseudo=false